MADSPNLGPNGIDHFSYEPMHDYRTVDVDAWAEQWFSVFSTMDPDGEEFKTAIGIMHRQLNLHPEYRSLDAADLEFGIMVLKSVGSSEAAGPRWQHLAPIFKLIARQIVRVTLEDAENYAALRVEQARSGTDHLTGVANRLGLTRRLDELYGITAGPVRSDPSGHALPPIKLNYSYLDGNRFKWLNNTFGHQVGDAAIVEIAWRCKEFFRLSESPIIFREGGDEFGVIVAGQSDSDIEQMFRRGMSAMVGRVTSKSFVESMALVNERLQAVRAAGQRVRAEARLIKRSQAELALGKRPRHMLYINGQPVIELGNIVSVSAGHAAGMVTTLSEVEQLRRSAEAQMERVKLLLDAIIDGQMVVPPVRP